jgi:4-diphosphocytidyl-2-C-methyl-D-erythritol kinase
MVEVEAPAKINLFLRILAQERSGYHQLETLFCSVAFGDVVTLEPGPPGIIVETSGLTVGPPEENLVFKAAQAFFAASGINGGVRIRLEKRTPLGAGLGGGSSDAAATLRGLHGLFPGGLDPARLLDLASGLGSDVPCFLSPSPLTLAWGRGERMLPLKPLPSAPVVLALPPVSVSTPEAFGALSRERQSRSAGSGPPKPGILDQEELSSWSGIRRLAENDFEPVVFREFPALARLRQAFDGTAPLLSLLSGSGSAVFGVYEDAAAAQVARDALAPEFPDIRFVLTRTEEQTRIG